MLVPVLSPFPDEVLMKIPLKLDAVKLGFYNVGSDL